VIDTVTDECSKGLVSATRLPPCSACPSKTFWQNAFKCEDCPAERRFTRGPQGGADISACKGLDFVYFFRLMVFTHEASEMFGDLT